MSLIETYHVVSYTVQEEDVVSIKDVMPPAEDGLHKETSDTNSVDEDSTEVRSGRAVYATTETVDGLKMAQAFYDDLAGAVTRDDAVIRLYLSPVGSVNQQDLRDYFEEHPDQRPTDEEGEPYIPSRWDPSHHIIRKE